MSNLAAPDILYTAIVTILAVILYIYMGIRVGQARGKYKIDAPAMTGHPDFERAVRIHANTMEFMVTFLPTLWLAALYFGGWIPPALGGVWVIGRVIYMIGYTASAQKRSLGFTIQAIAGIALLVLSIAGIVQAFMMA
ncbi:MAG TPA: MAPEG family protein [Rhizomicrobium sp.]|nr:MAPEG family protein [Rhizomicrobium sp.]